MNIYLNIFIVSSILFISSALNLSSTVYDVTFHGTVTLGSSPNPPTPTGAYLYSLETFFDSSVSGDPFPGNVTVFSQPYNYILQLTNISSQVTTTLNLNGNVPANFIGNNLNITSGLSNGDAPTFEGLDNTFSYPTVKSIDAYAFLGPKNPSQFLNGTSLAPLLITDLFAGQGSHANLLTVWDGNNSNFVLTYYSDPNFSTQTFQYVAPVLYYTIAEVPEPSTYMILGATLLYAVLLKKAKKQTASK